MKINPETEINLDTYEQFKFQNKENNDQLITKESFQNN